MRQKKVILITGACGFIGFHLSKELLDENNYIIIGLDNLNTYYDIKLKKKRLAKLKKFNNFIFIRCDISNHKHLYKVLKKYDLFAVYHLAAQAGVRYSFKNPRTYLDSNLIGFFNILEFVKNKKPSVFVFASSSSVYGNSSNKKFIEKNNTDKPLSFYAATKKSNEVMAYSYSKLFDIKTVCIRFFSVYGPYGRPDMAIYTFFKNILNGKKIILRDKGKHFRDYTYIIDTIEYLKFFIKEKNLKKLKSNFEIFNIGNSKPIRTIDLLNLVSKILNKKPQKVGYITSMGESFKTHANTNKLQKFTRIKKSTNIRDGLKFFSSWFKKYYNLKNN